MKKRNLNLVLSALSAKSVVLFFCFLSLCWGLALGDSGATTEADSDDPPVAAEMAPSYIAIGRDLSLRLSLVRRSVDELSLDPRVRGQANAVLNSCQQEVDDLVGQMEKGALPSSRKVLGVPGDLRAGRSELYEIIGPQESEQLDEMLRSLRGEARSTLAHVRLMLQEMIPPPVEMRKCEGIISAAEGKAESFPHLDLSAEEYDAQRGKLDGILKSVEEQLDGVLTPGELERLGPRFTASFPATK